MNGFKILSYDFSLSKNEMIDHLNENGIKYELKENNLIVYYLDVFYATLIYKNDKLDRVKIRFAKLSPEDQDALAIQLDSKYFLDNYDYTKNEKTYIGDNITIKVKGDIIDVKIGKTTKSIRASKGTTERGKSRSSSGGNSRSVGNVVLDILDVITDLL